MAAVVLGWKLNAIVQGGLVIRRNRIVSLWFRGGGDMPAESD